MPPIIELNVSVTVRGDHGSASFTEAVELPSGNPNYFAPEVDTALNQVGRRIVESVQARFSTPPPPPMA